jgi:hypothetical protein
MISSFSNFVNELLMPIAQKDTAIAMVIAIAAIMIVEITILIAFLLHSMFLLIPNSLPCTCPCNSMEVEAVFLIFQFCGKILNHLSIRERT